MPEEIQWLHLNNSVGGINKRDTVLRIPSTDATVQRNVDLISGGFKKANGTTRFVEAPLLASGTYLQGTIDPTAESDAWTGSGDATTISFTGGVMTNDESAGATGFQIYHNPEAGFTTGVDATFEIRCKIRASGTLSGVYAFSICVLDDATDRLELVAIDSGGTKSVAILATPADRTVIGSYSNVTTHDWTAFTRYRIVYDASGNVEVFIVNNATTTDLNAAAITIAVSSLPASTQTSRLAFGSYETTTVVISDVDYVVYKTTAVTLDTDTISGVFDFEDETNSHFQLMSAGTRLFRFDSATADWIELTGGTAFTADSRTYFSVGREISGGTAICIITTEDQDTPQKFDGSTRADLAGSPPSGKYSAIFNDRTFIANTSAAPTGVFFSATGDSEDRDDGAGTWDTTNDVFLIDRFVFGSITGLRSVGGSQDQSNMLLVFLEKGIKRLTGWGKGSFLLETVTSLHGCVAPSSLIVGPLGPERNEGVYFRDKDAYYWTDGRLGNVIRISEKILTIIKDTYNLPNANLDVGFIDKTRSLVGFSHATGSASTPDDTVAFDYFNGGRGGEDGRVLESWGNYDYDMTAANNYFSSNGQDITVFGTTGGVVFITDSGTNLDGANYTGSRETAWFDIGTPYYAKMWRYLTIYTNTVASFDLEVSWALDWSDSFVNTENISQAGTTFTLGTSQVGVGVLGSVGVLRERIELNSVANSIKFRFRTTSKAENFIMNAFTIGFQQTDWIDSNV